MLSRRDFLKVASVAGGAAVLNVRPAWARSLTAEYFGLHDFVENSPDAVFVLRTTVDSFTNADAIRAAGYDLGKTLFVGKPGPPNAYPLSTLVAVKPNMTCRGKWQATGDRTYSAAKTRGTQTESSFVEGIINSIKDLGVPGGQFYVRETNCYEDFADGGFIDMAQRTGAVLEDLSYPVAQLPPSKVQWMDIPQGVWYNRIPYLWPVNAPNSCLLNIAKFKSHSMGMTLTAKKLPTRESALPVDWSSPSGR